jgi:hypothetical protein
MYTSNSLCNVINLRCSQPLLLLNLHGSCIVLEIHAALEVFVALTGKCQRWRAAQSSGVDGLQTQLHVLQVLQGLGR